MPQSSVDGYVARPEKPARDACSVKLLQVEPTTRCNFTCGFCCGRRMDQSDMEFQTFQRALALFPHLERLELHGEGEPMLSPHFFDMARTASNRGVVVSAITNGSMFSKRRIDKLLDSGIQALFVSIESAQSPDFKNIRGGSLAKVKHGIRALLEARDARGQSHPSVGFSVTVLKSTQDQLRAIAELYLALNMDGGISVHMLNTMPDYLRHYTQDMRSQTLTGTEQALSWVRYGRMVRDPAFKRARMHFSDVVFGQIRAGDTNGIPRRGSVSAREYRSCPWLDDALYVNRHGIATGCARIKDTDRYGFGDISSGDPGVVLERRRRLSERIRAGEVDPACKGCFIAESIGGRLSRLADRRPRAKVARLTRERWEAAEGRAAGVIPYDSAVVRQVLSLCDGSRTGKEIIDRWAADSGTSEDDARRRALPVLGELHRLRAIGFEEQRQ